MELKFLPAKNPFGFWRGTDFFERRSNNFSGGPSTFGRKGLVAGGQQFLLRDSGNRGTWRGSRLARTKAQSPSKLCQSRGIVGVGDHPTVDVRRDHPGTPKNETQYQTNQGPQSPKGSRFFLRGLGFIQHLNQRRCFCLV